MEPIIQKFKKLGNKKQFVEHLILLKEQYPGAKFIVKGKHNGSFIVGEDGTREYNSQLILSEHVSTKVLILGNPYEGTGYHAGRTKINLKSNHINVFAGNDFKFIDHASDNFLWVDVSTVSSYEVHYKPANNKEAALNVLTRLDDY